MNSAADIADATASMLSSKKSARGLWYTLLSYGFSVDLAFISVTLNCVHMLEQLLKLLALKQSDYYLITRPI